MIAPISDGTLSVAPVMNSMAPIRYCALAIRRRLLITHPTAANAAPSTSAIVAPSRPARLKQSAASAAPGALSPQRRSRFRYDRKARRTSRPSCSGPGKSQIRNRKSPCAMRFQWRRGSPEASPTAPFRRRAMQDRGRRGSLQDNDRIADPQSAPSSPPQEARGS
jgi:hypothetical protein